MKKLLLSKLFLLIVHEQTVPHIPVESLLLEDSLVFDSDLVGYELHAFLFNHFLEQVVFNLYVEVVNVLNLRLSLDRKPHGVGTCLRQQIANVLLEGFVAVKSVEFGVI